MAIALVRPVDIASLAAFRVLFGLLMFVGLARFLLSDWVAAQYLKPQFHFKYLGFSWVRVWPDWGMYLHLGVLCVLAMMIACGLFHRVATALFLLGFSYVQMMDVTNYLNHYYLVALLSLLLCVVPAHRAFSLDAWRRPSLATATVPTWALYLVRFQVAVVYFYAGLAKLGSDWLLDAQPLGIWLQARTGIPLLGPLFAEPWVPLLMSWAGFIYDSTVVCWLLWSRTRLFAYLVLAAFHAVTGALFDIGIFPFIMTLSALVFFSPSWPRALLRRDLFCRRRTHTPVVSSSLPRDAPRSHASAVLGGRAVVAVALYCLVQVVVPLRHFAYPGDVLWNEQGIRLSWKVMVREKHGAVTYYVHEPCSGKHWQVTPAEYLTPRQEGEMSAQPDLILQLAHHIAHDFAERGIPNVEVRAQALVSLNGRPAAPMIDPEVDLARVRDGLWPAAWILPSPGSRRIDG